VFDREEATQSALFTLALDPDTGDEDAAPR
jgi:hypothetical protein